MLVRGVYPQRCCNAARQPYAKPSCLQTLQPSHDEHNARADLVSRLKSVILSIPEFVGPEGECLAELVMYGSYVSGLYNSTSDMDIMLTGAAQLSSGRVVPLVGVLLSGL